MRKRWVRRWPAAALVCLLAGMAPRLAAAEEFSFYVLALSWSPSYCESRGAGADPQQCRAAKPYAFVIHGLWPQREKGYPGYCKAPERDVPRKRIRALGDIMPSAGLVRYEWRKHGACSGLTQDDYFTLLRKAHDRVAIPAQFRRLQSRHSIGPRLLEQLFIRANPGMAADGIAVACEDGLIEEVRVCLSKDLDFRHCPEVDRRACTRSQAAMPPTGG